MGITIVHQLSETDFIIQCAFCAGRGLEPKIVVGWKVDEYMPNEACSMCKGKGVLRVHVNDVVVADACCQGTGLERETSDEGAKHRRVTKCATCKGVGARSVSGELKV